MGQCLEKSHPQRRLMSHNHTQNNTSLSTKHVKKKVKQETTEQQSSNIRQNYRQMNTTTGSTTMSLEPRRDLPLHKIPELLAKITGTFSSTLSGYDNKQSSLLNLTSNAIDYHLKLFKSYSDNNNQDIMIVDGILRFCNDLTIEPDSYELLLFCFLCRAKQMYSLTKDEFLNGLRNLETHILNLTDLRTSLINYDVNKYENEFYIWTYQYGLIDGQRCLITQNACALWRLLYSKSSNKPQILDQWLRYLEQETNNEIPKTITCDTWKIFPQFAKFIESNGYQAYDDSEAWPCLFDGFVEYQLEEQKKAT